MKTNILTLLVTLTVGVILAGALLAPVVSDAQKTAGEQVKLSNVETGITYNSYEMGAMDGDSSVTLLLQDSVLTVNGTQVPISHSGTVGQLAINNDGSYIGIRSNGAALYLFQYVDGVQNLITINPGISVVVSQDKTMVGDTEYATGMDYCIGAESDNPVMRYFPNTTHKIYVDNINDVSVLATYTVDDTTLNFGVTGTTGTLTGHTVAVDYSLKLVDGYTDIYELETYSVTVDGAAASISSWYAFEYVDGHEASGAIYSLYGVLPVLLIVALVLAAVSMVIRNKD